jgi:hypothetical protein
VSDAETGDAATRGDDATQAWARHRRRQRRLIAASFVLALLVYTLLRTVIAPWLNPLLGL